MEEGQFKDKISELSTIIKGDVLLGDVDRALYSTDASLYSIKPAGIIVPGSVRDIVEALKFCRANHIPLTARGSGSGLAGSAINKGLILDFVPRMNRILEIDAVGKTVSVEPGVFQSALNEELSDHDLFFPPNPSSADYCTIGGMIACNSSGGKSVKYGATTNYVESLKLVLYNGEVVTSRAYGEEDPRFLALLEEDSQWGRINREVYELCKKQNQVIGKYTPDVPKNCSGYDLAGVLRDGIFDINKAIAGSEGTLAVIAEARLRLAPKPLAKQSALLFFETLEKGGNGIIEILKFGPSTCEIMAEDFVGLVKKDRPDVAAFMPEKAGTALLLEFEGRSDKEVGTLMSQCLEHLEKCALLLDYKIAYGSDDQARLWAMRKAALPIIYNRPGLDSPVTFVEDCTVRPDKLPLYLRGISEIFEKHGVDSTAYGHGGDGNIHTRPLMNLRLKEDVDKLEPIARDVYELACSLGATFSGEHGDGMLRSKFLPDLFGPLYDLFIELKRIFDPERIINPGKILNEERSLFTNQMRMKGGEYKIFPSKTLIDNEEILHNLEKCHGCSQCRTFCPVVLTTGSEKALPRAKNNLARSILYGDLDGDDLLTSPDVKEILDLCYNCKTCLHECPTHVDTGLVMQHMKNNFHDKRGKTLGETVISNAELLGKAATFFNPISNKALKLKPVRALMAMTLGLSENIILPPYAMKPFKAEAKSGDTENQPIGRIAYFAGCTALYNKKGEAEAFIKIMEHLGYEVVIPEQKCCGLAKLGLGNYAAAKKHIQYNTERFAPYLEEGYIPVTACPSCHFMMSEGSMDINEDENVKNLAGEFREAMDLINEILKDREGDIPLENVNVTLAYKNACHARETGPAAKELLGRIPGINIATWYDKCCGMGGTFGMKSKYRDKSETIGRVMGEELSNGGADTMSTSCGACAVQVESVTGLEPVHPLVLVAQSLGVL